MRRSVAALVITMVANAGCGGAALESSPTTTGGGAQEPAPAARVDIDVTSPRGVVSPLLFGMHIEWVNNGQGLLDPAQPALRDAVLRRLGALSVPLFRFPGGILADYYDWQLGVGARGTSVNVFTRAVEPHRFGTPELASLLRDTNAAAMITANYGTGTPELANKWAAHMAANNIRAPYWEVGNEIYLADPDADQPNGRAIYHSGESYGRDFGRYRDAIRAALPSASVGAIAHVDTGRFALAPPRNVNWTTEMLPALGRADFFSMHTAYAPVIVDDAVRFDTEADRIEVYRSLYGAAAQVRESLTQMADLVARLSPVNSTTPFALTEFGPFFGITTKPALHAIYVDQSRTVGAALYVATILDMLLDYPRVTIACYTNPIHPWFGSLITDTPEGLVLTPTYYLYQLYRARFERQLVRADVVAPTFSTRAVGIAKPQVNLPDLVVKAATSDDRSRLTAMLVNRSAVHALNVTLTVRGFEPTTVDCQLLGGSSPSLRNGPGLTPTTSSSSAAIAPRAVSCAAAATMSLSIPANSIISIVAQGKP
jgi:alpha-N-arabinofuranosidase